MSIERQVLLEMSITKPWPAELLLKLWQGSWKSGGGYLNWEMGNHPPQQYFRDPPFCCIEGIIVKCGMYEWGGEGGGGGGQIQTEGAACTVKQGGATTLALGARDIMWS